MSTSLRSTFTAIVQRNAHGGGYIAKLAELPGPVAQGSTFEATVENLRKEAAIFLLLNREFSMATVEGAAQYRPLTVEITFS